ncbi:MAG TPA: class I SAM-dependent methyltransferase [Gemmataceae bacterium]|nr:class I SAM-dependent methyltransferase [Gemmataceae bacterium]
MVLRATDSEWPPLPIVGGHSPKRAWDIIDHPDEVRRVLERIRRTARFDVYRCADLYDLAYPGYGGDADYYLSKGRVGKVLYLGVGTGRIFTRIAQLNPEAIGLDTSGEMIDWLM